jgi:sensor c-di-GMP phosphodiesterase-like protein
MSKGERWMLAVTVGLLASIGAAELWIRATRRSGSPTARI